MAGFITRDGRNVPTFDMVFGRIDLVAGYPTPIPIESESLRIKSASTNGAAIIYVGNDDVSLFLNGYELNVGNSIQVSGGLGQYLAANTIYVVADIDATIFYMIQN